MDSYEYDPETQDALPQSGDGDAVPDDSQTAPPPEPVDTSWEGVPLPESAPAADPDIPNPDAQAAQTPPKVPENEAVIPADAPATISEPAQTQTAQTQTAPEQSAQGKAQPVQQSAAQEQNAPQQNAPEEPVQQSAVQEQAAPEQNAPQQSAPRPPQADAPRQPEVVVCPRCRNTIPFQNFCPVCAFSLRGMPPAQPAPPAPPVIPYGAPPVTGIGPNAPYPPYGYRPQQPYMPPTPPAAPGFSSGYLPPTPPLHYAATYPPPYAKPKKSKGLVILGVVLAGVAALCTIVVLVLTAIMFSANVGGRPEDQNPFSDYFGNSDEYIPPFNGGDEQIPPGEVYPQYFIGDTVTKNDIVYDFDSCRTEQKYGESFIVVGITVQNKSGESFTLTPDLFRLENAMGGSYDYYGDPDTFHSPLERVVLMPGEKTSKNLTYVFDGGTDVDYIPLYVLDGSGNTLFFVYLQLYE